MTISTSLDIEHKERTFSSKLFITKCAEFCTHGQNFDSKILNIEVFQIKFS